MKKKINFLFIIISFIMVACSNTINPNDNIQTDTVMEINISHDEIPTTENITYNIFLTTIDGNEVYNKDHKSDVVKIKDIPNGEYKLIVKTLVQNNTYIFSQNIKIDSSKKTTINAELKKLNIEIPDNNNQSNGELEINISHDEIPTTEKITYNIFLSTMDGNEVYNKEHTADIVRIKDIPNGEYKLIIKTLVKNNTYTYSQKIKIDSSKKILINAELKKLNINLTVTTAAIGVNIAISSFPLDASEISIIRTNLDTNTEQQIIIINPNLEQNKDPINDTFINKDQRYSYKLYCKKYGTINAESNTSEPIVAQTGYGELQIATAPEAKYDSLTTLLTFQQKPLFSTQNIKDIEHNKYHYHFYIDYECFEPYNILQLYLSDSINVSAEIRDEKYFGRTYTLKRMSGFVFLSSNVSYCVPIEDVSKLPSSITVNNPQFNITAESTSNTNGVIVTFDKNLMPEGTTTIFLGRHSTKYGSNGSGSMPYCYSSTRDVNVNSMIDYFATPNDEYEYIISFADKNGDTISRSKKITITALSGLGNGLQKESQLRYDKNNNTSTISPIPNINLTSLNLSEQVDVKYELTYRQEPPFYTVFSKTINNEGIAEWGNSFLECDKDSLSLQSYAMHLDIKNTTYNLIVYTNELKEYLDQESFNPIIPDSSLYDKREQLKLKNTDKGIEIELPQNITKDSTNCIITRKNLSKNNDKTEFFLMDYKNYNSQTILDELIYIGDRYEYSLKISDWINGEEKIYYESLPTIIPSNGEKALGGLGEFTLEKYPKASYDKNTGIMTFDVLPDISQAIKTSLKNPNEKFTSYLTYKEGKYGHAMYAQVSESIDCNTEINQEYLGQDIVFKNIDINLIKNGLKYYKSYMDFDINTDPTSPNIPPVINVPITK